jgi:hypothetical protein
MELEDLLADSSRKTAELAVNFVGNDEALFKKMLDFALLDRNHFSMRAARVIQMATAKHPELIKPFVPILVTLLSEFKVEGLRRSTLRILADYIDELTEKEDGTLMDACFKFILDFNQKPAIIVYSMDILYALSNKYPDIKPELISCIENQLPVSSAGIKSRSQKMLRKLYQELEVRS